MRDYKIAVAVGNYVVETEAGNSYANSIPKHKAFMISNGSLTPVYPSSTPGQGVTGSSLYQGIYPIRLKGYTDLVGNVVFLS